MEIQDDAEAPTWGRGSMPLPSQRRSYWCETLDIGTEITTPRYIHNTVEISEIRGSGYSILPLWSCTGASSADTFTSVGRQLTANLGTLRICEIYHRLKIGETAGFDWIRKLGIL